MLRACEDEAHHAIPKINLPPCTQVPRHGHSTCIFLVHLGPRKPASGSTSWLFKRWEDVGRFNVGRRILTHRSVQVRSNDVSNESAPELAPSRGGCKEQSTCLGTALSHQNPSRHLQDTCNDLCIVSLEYYNLSLKGNKEAENQPVKERRDRSEGGFGVCSEFRHPIHVVPSLPWLCLCTLAVPRDSGHLNKTHDTKSTNTRYDQFVHTHTLYR
ncbi:hypothetical protein LZ30DRAFT_163840 [Colletotrichum cereale]|nr:hypothetical protein LZ30DRAFT_163840 [Colletotrichum cereale]